MLDLITFFEDHFADRQHSTEELMRYTPEHLIRLNANNVGNALDAIIADVQAKFTAYATCLGNKEFQAAARKAANQAKAAFRKALRVPIGKCAAAVEAAFGKPSADYTACFPEGRDGIVEAEEGMLTTKLTALITALTARNGATGIAAQVTAMTALKTTWVALLAASTAADTTEETTDAAKAVCRKNLTVSLSKSALFCAFTFFENMDKANSLLPLDLLRNRVPQPPGVPVANIAWDTGENAVLGDVTAERATLIRSLRSSNGGVSYDDDGTFPPGAFRRQDMSPGTYLYQFIAVNDAGESNPSEPIEIIVP